MVDCKDAWGIKDDLSIKDDLGIKKFVINSAISSEQGSQRMCTKREVMDLPRKSD